MYSEKVLIVGVISNTPLRAFVKISDLCISIHDFEVARFKRKLFDARVFSSS